MRFLLNKLKFCLFFSLKLKLETLYVSYFVLDCNMIRLIIDYEQSNFNLKKFHWAFLNYLI
jgi:hypothetical protein